MPKSREPVARFAATLNCRDDVEAFEAVKGMVDSFRDAFPHQGKIVLVALPEPAPVAARRKTARVPATKAKRGRKR